MEASEQPPPLVMHVPPEVESGSYANFLGVWHTAHEFTLDFGVTLPPQQDESGTLVMPSNIVARVKIAPTLVFQVLQALNDNMTRYEQTFGEIKRPGGDS